MKRFLLSVVLATTLALTSCQFDDSDIWGKLDEYGQSIKDHEQRILALEELCKQMNTNIKALQTLVDALEKRDYVTNVSEVRSNGEIIGYTISFAYSDTITIYHGQDGKDGVNGVDGKDGYTPQIGVMKDTDGIYYWTLNGEWLLDAKGNKIKAVGTDGTNGSDGKDGQDGTDGKDGADGITPQLKIENDYWYVSYDNGATWVQLGKATGEDGKDGQDGNDGADGSDGADGEDGDSIFKSVTQDDEYVYFNLADGTMITLPKHDKENIQFEDFNVKRTCVALWDTNNDFELSYAEAASVTSIGTTFASGEYYFFDELQYFTGVSEIETGAFASSKLMKVVIPSGVRTIGEKGFYNCKNLKRVDMLCDNLNIIGVSAFQNSAIKEIIIPNNVRQIDKYAFYNCSKLEKLTFEENSLLSCIGESAFTGTLIYSVTIPASVSTIGIKAFLGCPIQTLIFEKDSNLEIIKGISAKFSANDYDYKGAFAKCEKLQEVVIPKSVKILEGGVFEECTSLKKVNFEDGAQITELQGFFFTDLQCDNCRGHGVFTGCTSLETIILPKSITIIGDGSFRGCTNLKSVEFEIGSNLSSICGDRCGHTSGSSGSSGVFQGCSYLSTIKLGTSTPPY